MIYLPIFAHSIWSDLVFMACVADMLHFAINLRIAK